MLPKSCFLHVPKTGGNWVNQALAVAGVPCQTVQKARHPQSWAGYGHADLGDLAGITVFRFAFVREPTDWWRSFWAYRMRTGWDAQHEIDSVCRSDHFGVFIEQVVARLPGYISRMYERFVGMPRHEIEYVGRFENLAEDLIWALRRAGETFDDTAIRHYVATKVNASDYSRLTAVFPPGLRHALQDAEKQAIQRFGY
jgi:hypothetical protein